MGFDNTSLRIHCWLKSQGNSFDKVATLGRQTIYGITKDSFIRIANKFQLPLKDSQATEILNGSDGYADGIYRWLGATSVDSFDYSSYEKATHLWDMNDQLSNGVAGQYDFVFDGGTLEHVFNYTGALRESMTLPRVGGILLSGTPANSYLGHGFYQLGPDLPFAVLNAHNGYTFGQALLIEMRYRSRFYEILPPSVREGRALASTTWPTQMFFWGVRASAVPLSIKAFQPDYMSAWEVGEHQERSPAGFRSTIRKGMEWLPVELRNDMIRTAKLAYVAVSQNSLFDHTSFRRRLDI